MTIVILHVAVRNVEEHCKVACCWQGCCASCVTISMLLSQGRALEMQVYIPVISHMYRGVHDRSSIQASSVFQFMNPCIS